MGFGRAGWYSYDQLDQRGKSADTLVEAWQALAVGDIMPTHPGGGFEVAALEPGRSLVLRSDTALVTAQTAAARTTPAIRDRADPGRSAGIRRDPRRDPAAVRGELGVRRSSRSTTARLG